MTTNPHIDAAVQDWAADVGMVEGDRGDEEAARATQEYEQWLDSLDAAAEYEREREGEREMLAYYDHLAQMDLERRGWPERHPLDKVVQYG